MQLISWLFPAHKVDILGYNQGWGQVQLVKYSNTSSTRNQVQVLCIFINQVLKYIKYECEHWLAYMYGKYQGGISRAVIPGKYCPVQ